jgi:hypothetical protein
MDLVVKEPTGVGRRLPSVGAQLLKDPVDVVLHGAYLDH